LVFYEDFAREILDLYGGFDALQYANHLDFQKELRQLYSAVTLREINPRTGAFEVKYRSREVVRQQVKKYAVPSSSAAATPMGSATPDSLSSA
jgi:hypothetical protein